MVQGAISRQLEVLRTQAGAETPAGAYSYVAPAGGIARIGSVGEIASALRDSSAVVTVPEGVSCMVVAACGYEDSTAGYFNQGTLTLAGVALREIQANDISALYGYSMMWVITSTDFEPDGFPTGSQTLDWAWYGANNADNGVYIFYAFYSGVNTTTPNKASGGQATDTTSATTGALSAASGDKVVAVGYNDGASGDITWTAGATEVADNNSLGNGYGGYAEGDPTGNVTVSVTGAAIYTNVSAIVLQPAA